MYKIGIEIENFLDSCDEKELNNIIEYLYDNDYLLKTEGIIKERSKNCNPVFEDELYKTLGKIYKKREEFSYDKLNILKRIFKL